MNYPHLAQRLFDKPLAIDPAKAEVILRTLGPRLDLGGQGAQNFDLDDRDHLESEGDSVGLVPVYGSLVHKALGAAPPSLLLSYGEITRNFQAAIDNPDVRAVVLDVDSPGGEIAGLFETVDTIRAARGAKPITAIVDEQATSAAYAIASAADRVVIPKTGVVGSIGVLAAHLDRSARDEQEGLRYSFISSGAQKLDANPHAPLGDDARGRVEKEVARVANMLFDVVAENRGISRQAVAAQDAALYHGGEAVFAGLADEVMAPGAALQRIVEDPTAAAPQSSGASRQEAKGESWDWMWARAHASARDMNSTAVREAAPPKDEAPDPTQVRADEEWRQVLADRGMLKSDGETE